jgi:hypothetical protein
MGQQSNQSLILSTLILLLLISSSLNSGHFVLSTLLTYLRYAPEDYFPLDIVLLSILLLSNPHESPFMPSDLVGSNTQAFAPVLGYFGIY